MLQRVSGLSLSHPLTEGGSPTAPPSAKAVTPPPTELLPLTESQPHPLPTPPPHLGCSGCGVAQWDGCGV